jgi:hypothetical protein
VLFAWHGLRRWLDKVGRINTKTNQRIAGRRLRIRRKTAAHVAQSLPSRVVEQVGKHRGVGTWFAIGRCIDRRQRFAQAPAATPRATGNATGSRHFLLTMLAPHKLLLPQTKESPHRQALPQTASAFLAVRV